MKFTPRQYQLEAMKFLISRPNAGLMLDMGLGKTAITLHVIEALKRQKLGHKTFLIAPLRTLYTTWPEEIAKWDLDLTYHNLHESRLTPKDKLPPVDIYGINPESSLKYIHIWSKQIAHDMDFRILMVDESSQYKNHDTARFREIRGILHYFHRHWILTGTPAPNGLIDLWSQVYLLDQGQALGKYITHFRRAFCEEDYNGYDWFVKPEAESEIYRRVGHMCLRFDAQDHIDMPTLVRNRVPVKLPPKARAQYKEMEDTFLLALDEETTVMSPNTAALGIKCRQIANGGIYDNNGKAHRIHDAKTEALVEIIEELQGRPCIVFYEFKHDAERIAAAIGNPPPLTPETLKRFNEGKIPVLAAHTASIAFGLNLQEACSNVIFYGITWDLGAHDQAVARVWRSGQKAKRVIAHYLVAEDTLDENVLKTLEGKARTQKALLNALKGPR